MIFRQHLFKNRLPLMNKAMDAYALRQRTIAKNIANVDSPDYRPERVRFEEYFQSQEVVLKGNATDTMHIPAGKPDEGAVKGNVEESAIPAPEVYFTGENHVNIDKEMSALAENQIRFRFASQMTSRYFKGLNSAITGAGQ